MSETSENRKLRFVILFHEFPDGDSRKSHWDLMLEKESELLTWRLDDCPSEIAAIEGQVIDFTVLPNHRLEYLEFEGPISGDRGSVKRIKEGTYEWNDELTHQPVTLKMKSVTWILEFLEDDQVKLKVFNQVP